MIKPANTEHKDRPPDTWIAENFIHDGEITYCLECRIIPAIPMGPGHDCLKIGVMEAMHEGLYGAWATADGVTPDQIVMVENSDRPGDWCGYWPKERLAS